MANITKQQLKEYLTDNWDVTLNQIIKELKVSEKEVPKVEKFLKELEDEEWIRSAYCGQHDTIEYDPSDAQGDYWR